MCKYVSCLFVMLGLNGFFFCPQAANLVRLETTFGNIVIELDSAKAPITVANFLGYVRSSFYNGTIFHRVIKDFMIQGGGLTVNMTLKTTGPAIRNEAFNGLSNVSGTIAMARTSAPHSATSQFYINTVDNTYLDFKDSATNAGWGYCVFGKVVEGMSVVDSIEKVPTTTTSGYQNVPVTPIIINNAVEVATCINTSAMTRPSCSVTFRPNGSCFVEVVHNERNACFELYNLKGRTVLPSTGIKPGLSVVPINKLSSGVYIFRIKTSTELIISGTILKQ